MNKQGRAAKATVGARSTAIASTLESQQARGDRSSLGIEPKPEKSMALHRLGSLRVRGARGASIQPKLKISNPGDKHEREADRVADKAMRMPDSEAQHPAKLSVTSGATGTVHNAYGKPLAPVTRAFMDPRFGRSFSDVRVHTDSQAAASARVIGARSFTIGRDIFFDQGQYAPGTLSGRRLLTHELTHVCQQSPVRHDSSGFQISSVGGPVIQRATRKERAEAVEELLRQRKEAMRRVNEEYEMAGGNPQHQEEIRRYRVALSKDYAERLERLGGIWVLDESRQEQILGVREGSLRQQRELLRKEQSKLQKDRPIRDHLPQPRTTRKIFEDRDYVVAPGDIETELELRRQRRERHPFPELHDAYRDLEYGQSYDCYRQGAPSMCETIVEGAQSTINMHLAAMGGQPGLSTLGGVRSTPPRTRASPGSSQVRPNRPVVQQTKETPKPRPNIVRRAGYNVLKAAIAGTLETNVITGGAGGSTRANPVQVARNSAASSESAAPSRPTKSPAPSRPTKSPAPSRPTKSPAPSRPTKSAAPSRPTKSPAPSRPRSSVPPTEESSAGKVPESAKKADSAALKEAIVPEVETVRPGTKRPVPDFSAEPNATLLKQHSNGRLVDPHGGLQELQNRLGSKVSFKRRGAESEYRQLRDLLDDPNVERIDYIKSSNKARSTDVKVTYKNGNKEYVEFHASGSKKLKTLVSAIQKKVTVTSGPTRPKTQFPDEIERLPDTTGRARFEFRKATADNAEGAIKEVNRLNKRESNLKTTIDPKAEFITIKVRSGDELIFQLIDNQYVWVRTKL